MNLFQKKNVKSENTKPLTLIEYYVFKEYFFYFVFLNNYCQIVTRVLVPVAALNTHGWLYVLFMAVLRLIKTIPFTTKIYNKTRRSTIISKNCRVLKYGFA